MSDPKLPNVPLYRVLGILRYRLSKMGFPAQEPWNIDALSALLSEQDDEVPRAPSEVWELRSHLDAEDFHTALVADQIGSRFGLRIAHHLVGATCDRCRDTLAKSGPTPPGAAPSSDPLVLALRRVADSEVGRRAPTPMRRFLLERWREPLGFVRLVLEEALGVKVDDPAETVRRVAIAGIRLLPVAQLQMIDRDFEQVAALTHAAMGEALRRSRRIREGLAHLSEAYRLCWESCGAEVGAVLLTVRGRLDVDFGDVKTGIEELEQAAGLLERAVLAERWAQLLSEIEAHRRRWEPVAEGAG